MKHIRFVIAAVMLLVTAVASGASLRPVGRLAVIPQPQRAWELEGEPFRFTSDTLLWVPDSKDDPGAELIVRDLKFRFGFEPRIVHGDQWQDAKPGAGVVCLVRDKPPASCPMEADLLKQIQPSQAEGYGLLSDGTNILIIGEDQRGLLYGAQTLRQLIRADGTVRRLAICDWPEMPWRIAYGYFSGTRVQTLEQVDAMVEDAVLLKLNMVIFESPWSGTAGNWWYGRGNKSLADRFFADCRRYGIEPVPLIQGPGWGYGPTDLDPMTTEGVWVKEEALTLHVNHPTALAKPNVVAMKSAPIVVTDATGEIRYQEGKDFIVIQGKTVRPYETTNEPWKLQAVPGGAIADAQKVLVSYNCVPKRSPHMAYCLSEPRAYEIVDRAIDRVMENYKPRFIHIGHDELWQLATDSRCLQSGLEPQELVYRDLMHWYERVKSHDADTVIFMWDDLLRQKRVEVSTGILNPLAGKIPKDLILCPWYYYARADSPAYIHQRLQSQTAMGFHVVGTPSGYWMDNSYLWYRGLLPYLADGRAKGMMFTDWGEGLSGTNLPAAAELMWSGSRISKPLFDQFAALTQRLKSKNLGLAYAFDRPWQRTEIAKLFNDGLKSGQSADQIVKLFNEKVIGDTQPFEKAYGSSAWKTIAYDAPFPQQQAAMVRKIPIYFQLIADYIQAARGDHQASSALGPIIHQLHAMGCISHADEQKLLEQSQQHWLPAEALFGFKIELPQ